MVCVRTGMSVYAGSTVNDDLCYDSSVNACCTITGGCVRTGLANLNWRK